MPEDEDFILPLVNAYVPKRSLIHIDQTIEINLGTTENPHITHIVASLSEDEFQVFFDILHKWHINFAWYYANKLGLDPELVVHHLAINPNIKSVK